jgi:hypothetical protein
VAFVLQSTTNLRLIGTSDGTLSDTSTQLMRSVRAKVKVMQESMSHAFFATPQAGYLSEAMAQAKPAAQTAVFALFSGAAYASHLRPDATVALYFQFKTTIFSREFGISAPLALLRFSFCTFTSQARRNMRRIQIPYQFGSTSYQAKPWRAD